jgi:hypothetical protein
MKDQISEMNGNANSAQATSEAPKKSVLTARTPAEGDPGMKSKAPLPISELAKEDFVKQPLSFTPRPTTTSSTKKNPRVMNPITFSELLVSGTQAMAEERTAGATINPSHSTTTDSNIDANASPPACEPSTTTHTLSQIYSRLFEDLLAHIKHLETHQWALITKTTSLIATTQTQAAEISGLKHALSTAKTAQQEEKEAVVTEEMKLKYDELELRSIQLTFRNTRLEKENKGLRELVKRFEKLYGGIEEAEELDGLVS